MVNNYEDTLEFIKICHDGQYYGEKEYWHHCVSVSEHGSEFFQDDWSEAANIAALLHDVIEDTEYNHFDLVKKGYTWDIVYIVSLLTKDKSLSYEKNIKKIINSGNRDAMMVKYADNYVNFTGDKSKWNKSKKMKSQAKYAKSMNMLLEALYE
ncbi:MAG: HD domain-containing protein [archaeon]